jgi:xylulokinase
VDTTTDDWLLGIDVGTSTVKAAAFSVAGSLLECVRTATPTHRYPDGRVENDPDALWEATAGLVQTLVRGRSGRPLAVAVASVGEAGIPLDSAGQALFPIIAWDDQRSGEQARWWVEHVGFDRVHEVSGQAIDPHYGINKLMWLRQHEPEVFGRTATWLSVADLITLRLCGVVGTDVTLASRTMVFDQAARQWSRELLDAAGVDESMFPTARESGTAVGEVTRLAAEQTGLPAGTAVVVGGHDRLCGAFAARTHRDELVDSTGSAEAIVMPTRSYTSRSAEEGRWVAHYCDVVPGSYILSARVGFAGSLVDWFSTVLTHRGDRPTYDELVAELPRPPRFSGLLVFPSFGRVVTPFWDPTAAPGALLGLHRHDGRPAIVQALLEGSTYSLRANLALVEELVGATVPHIVVEGGAARNDVWMQLKADITQRPAAVSEIAEPTALGAAVLAGVGVGVFASHHDATEQLARPMRYYEPRADQAALYEQAYTAYLSAPDRLSGINAVLLRLRADNAF